MSIHVPPPGGGSGGVGGTGGPQVTAEIPPPDCGLLLRITSTVSNGGKIVITPYAGTEYVKDLLISPSLFVDIEIHYEDSCVTRNTPAFYRDALDNPEKDCTLSFELTDDSNIIQGEILVAIASHNRRVVTFLPYHVFESNNGSYEKSGWYITEVRSAVSGSFHAEGDVKVDLMWRPHTGPAGRWS